MNVKGRPDHPAGRYAAPMTSTPGLPREEELFRRIVEDSPAAVLLLTNEQVPHVMYASPRVEELTGFPADEMRRHPRLWFSRLHDDDAAAISARWNHAVDTGAAYSEEYRFLHRSGEWRVFRDRSTPMREDDGSIRYRQNYTEDITSERFALEQAERSEARLPSAGRTPAGHRLRRLRRGRAAGACT